MRVSTLVRSRRRAKKARRLRAWLNGVDVSRDCQMADDRRGVVLLVKRNEHGRCYLNSQRQIAKVLVHGRVRITRRERLDA